MDKLNESNKHLKDARDEHERDYECQMNKLGDEEKWLTERLQKLNNKKLEIGKDNGDVDAEDDDLVEINAGGKIIAAKRSTLTQLKGTRLEALFSGRWDNKLQRDGDGRAFLDVNPMCFQAIIDYLTELAISSEDNPPQPPSVDDEYQSILMHQLELFGLQDKVFTVKMPDSNIINRADTQLLHDWLVEDGSDGDFDLLYQSSRDGRNDGTFHSKCDNKGCTFTVIETVEGHKLGGYTNTAWSNNGGWQYANKAFLFVLSENGITSLKKMKLKNPNDQNAMLNHLSNGPIFGYGGRHDLHVRGSNIILDIGRSYDPGPSGQFANGTFAIKEMEVFQVSGKPTFTGPTSNKLKSTGNTNLPKVEEVKSFSKNVNDAINAKWASLEDFESELVVLEDGFEDEGTFFSFFANRRPDDVITLNVSGTIMATSRHTLQLCKDSSLAAQFSVTAHGKQDANPKALSKWNFEDVVAWMNGIEGVPESVVAIFDENEISGRELLAVGKEGLVDFGVTRKATIYLLLDEIKKLESASHASTSLIEHSPYCFEKILDYLRLEGAYMKDLVKMRPAHPVVGQSEKGKFEKVVKHYFPGESSKYILG